MEPLLGTYVEIVAEGSDQAQLQEAADEGFDAFREVDRLLSSFRADSELSKINAMAGVRPVAVSDWTYRCLERAQKIARESGGAFDITCRPLLDLWGFLKRNYRLPGRAELARARSRVGYRQLELATAANGTRTAFLRRGAKIDVGGIGKGFAVDRAVEAMKRVGVGSGLVRAWGDCFGFGPRAWSVAIEPSQNALLRNSAVSTSGDAENSFTVNGRRFGHIVDPRTGWPVEGRRSISVGANACVDSDAWTTALFVDPNLKPRGIRVLYFEREGR